MKRSITTTLATMFAFTLSASAREERSPEMKVLDHFIGTWDHEVTVKTPDGETTVDRVDTRKWSPGGKFLIFENSIDSKANPNIEEFYMVMTYDPEAKNYPAFFMSGTYRGLITGTWDEKSTTMHWKGEDADGENTSAGKHQFIGTDRAEVSLLVSNSDGGLVMQLSYKQTKRTAAGDQKAEKTESAKPTLDGIIEKYVAAIGGVDANKKVKTRRMEGTFTITEAGDPWKMTVTMKAPNLRHLKMDIPGFGIYSEGFDGKVAWKSAPNEGTTPFEGDELKQKKRDASFYGNLDLKSQYKKLTYEGRKKMKGNSFDVIKGADVDGNEVTLYLDAKSHMLSVMIRPEATIEMSDYTKIDGIQLPFSMDVSLPGQTQPFATMKLKKVTHGVKVDDALFAMPKD